MIMLVLLCYSGRDQPVPPTTKPGTAYIYSNYYLYNHQCFLLDSHKYNLRVCVCVGVGVGGAFMCVIRIGGSWLHFLSSFMTGRVPYSRLWLS